MSSPAASWRQADSEAVHLSPGNLWSGDNGESPEIALAAWAFLLSTLYDVPQLILRTASIVVDEDVPQDTMVPPKWRLTMERTIEIALDSRDTVEDFLATVTSAQQEPSFVNGERSHSDGFHNEPLEDSAPSSLLLLPADVHGIADALIPLGSSIFDLSEDLPYDLVIRPPAHAADGTPVFEVLFDGQTQDQTHVTWLLARYEDLIRAFCKEPRSRNLSDLGLSLSVRKHSHEASKGKPNGLPAPGTKESDLEQVMIQAWSDVLELSPHDISRASRFQDLGGNSLDAMKLAVRLQLRGYHLSVADIFQKPTLASLVEVTTYDDPSEEDDPVASQEMRSSWPYNDIAAQCSLPATDIEDVYPASPFQESVIALTLKQPGSYMTTRTYELADHVEISHLRAAWEAICAANPILRTRFVYLPEHGMLQVVVKDGPQWVEESSSGRKPQSREERWALGSPCLRLELLGIDHLCVTTHHAIYDGQSHWLILSDLHGYLHGLNPPVRPSYKVFIQYLQTVKVSDSETYWRSRLAGTSADHFPRPLDAPAQLHCTGKCETFMQLTSPRSSIVTAATLATAAWALVLARYSGSSDVSFGYISSGRSVPIDAANSIIGPLVSTVPMRITVERLTNVHDFLRQTQKDLLEVGSHAHFGLQSIQKLSQGAANACAFNNTFVVHPSAEQSMALNIVKPARGENMTLADYCTYPLHGSCTLDGEQLRMRLRFDPIVLSQDQANGMLDFYRHILTGLANVASNVTMAELWKSPASTPYFATPSVPTIDRCVHHIIQQRVGDHPDRPAVSSWDVALTYSQLDVFAERLAHHIKGLGVGIEHYVCFSFEKSGMAIVAQLAILKSGAAVVPIDIHAPPKRIQYVVNKCQSAVILCSSSQSAKLAGLTDARIVVADLPLVEGLPDDSRNVCEDVGPSNACYVLYTSGSTGDPKGVVWEHSTLSSSAQANAPAFNICPDSRILQNASFMWDISVLETLVPLTVGALVCVPSEDVKMSAIVPFMNEYRITWALFTPSHARTVDLEAATTLHTLGLLGERTGQDNIDRFRTRVPQLITGYGPTETCMVSAAVDLTAQRQIGDSNLGFPTNASISIVDPDDPNLLVPHGSGGIGEIYMEGPSLARGYLDAPDLTAQAFLADPPWAPPVAGQHRRFYRSGDLGYFSGDGSIVFAGRKDDQIKAPGGQRLEPGEVEQCLLQLPFIRHAMVLMSPSPSHNDRLLAVISLTPDAAEGQQPRDLPAVLRSRVQEVQEHLSDRIPRFGIPALWLPIENTPMTAAGKLDRSGLRGWVQDIVRAPHSPLIDSLNTGADRRGDPETPLQRTLGMVWAQVLGISVDDIAPHHSFIELRGDSLSAIKLVALLHRQNLSLTVANVFRHPTLEEMASVLSAVDTLSREAAPFALLPDTTDIEQLLTEASRECSIDVEQIEDMYPSTPLQESLATMEAQHSGTYVANAVWELAPTADLARIQSAWTIIEQQHHVLRSRIVHLPTAGTCQVVMRQGLRCDIERDDLELYLRQSRNNPVDFGDALVRPALVGRNFVLTLHHAVHDFQTFSMIIEDLVAVYRGKDLKPRPPFRQFIGYLNSRTPLHAQAFWRSHLQDTQPIEFPRLPTPTYLPSTDSCHEKVMQFARPTHLRVTTATIANAAWALLLASYAGANEACFGTVLSGRDIPLHGVEDILGPTIATVPVRVGIDRETDVQSFLRQLQHSFLDMMEHQHLGMQRIKALHAGSSEACKFRTFLAIQPPTDRDSHYDELLHKTPELPGKSATRGEMAAFGAYALALQLQLTSEGARLKFFHDSHVIDDRQIVRIAQYFEHIFRGIIELPSDVETPLGDVVRVSDADRAELESWAGPSLEADDVLLLDKIALQTARTPTLPAVCSWDGDFSFEELDKQASRLADYLVSVAGVQPGALVALCCVKSRWTVVAMLAILKANAAFLALSTGDPPERARQILAKGGVRTVLVSPSLLVEKSQLAYAVYPVDVAADRDQRPRQRISRPSPSSLAYCITTSGSTGTPKIVRMSHAAMSTYMTSITGPVGITARTRVLQFAAFVWDAAVFEIFGPLTVGGCVCLPSEEARLDDLAAATTEMGAEWALFTPTFARGLEPKDFPTLKTMCLGGEACGADNIRRWASKVRLLSVWGMAETAPLACVVELHHPDQNLELGVPINCRLWIVETEAPHRIAPIGAVGMIAMEGPCLSDGYLDDPELTAACFVTPKCSGGKLRQYLTSDMARYDSHGKLLFVGRADDLVKVNGQRLSLGEVEFQLRQCEAVRDAIVLLPNQGPFSQRLVALFSDRDSGSQLPGGPIAPIHLHGQRNLSHQIMSSLRQLLPSHGVPSVLIEVGHLPHVASGKVDRTKARQWLTDMDGDEAVNIVQNDLPAIEDLPRDASESCLAQTWADVLSISPSQIGRNSMFTQLGGDSIKAIQLRARLRSRGYLLAVKDVFNSSILRDMATCMIASTSRNKTKPFSLLDASDAAKLMMLLQEATVELSMTLGDIEDLYPATPVQETFWLAEMAHPGTSYTTFVYHVADEIPTTILQSAWRAVTQSHHILRTRFIHLDHKTYQVVCRSEPPFTEASDWTHFESGAREQKGAASESLCSLTRAGEYVVLGMHHACYDSVSFQLVVDDLIRACHGHPLRQLPAFRDFIGFAMDPERNISGERFWQETLKGASETKFPHATDKSIALATGMKRSTLVFDQPRHTIATVVNAAWALLLSACEGSEDVVFGSILTGRDAPVDDIAIIPGPTMSTMPLRLIVRPTQTAAAFLQDVQQRSLDVMEHQHFGMQNIARVSPDAKMFQRSDGAEFCQLYSPSLLSENQAECIFQSFREIFHRLAACNTRDTVADISPPSLVSLGRELRKTDTPRAELTRFQALTDVDDGKRDGQLVTRRGDDPAPDDDTAKTLPPPDTEYWRHYLSDCEPCIMPVHTDDYLPVDTTVVDEKLDSLSLGEFCLAQDFSPVDAISAAWALLLASYTAERSVCYGSLGSLRAPERHPSDFPTFMLVQHIEIIPTESLVHLTRRVRKDRLRSLQHSNASTETVLGEIFGSAPILNTALSIRDGDESQKHEKSCVEVTQAHEGDAAPNAPAPWDLFLDVFVETERLAMRLVHSGKVGSNLALRITNTLISILTVMVTTPEAHCSHPDLTSACDKAQIVQWNDANVEPDHGHGFVHSLIVAQAQCTPDRPAVVAWDGTLKYAELDQMSTNLAHHLVSLGIKTGDSVPYCLEKSVWTPMVVLAIMKSGAVFTPLSPEDPIERQMTLMRRCAARCLVVSPSRRQVFANLAIPIVMADSQTFNDLPERHGAACNDLRPESLVYALFTSGSTGESKTVLEPHSAWLAFSRLIKSLLDYKPGMRALQFASHVWDVSLSELIIPLVYGGTTYIPSEQERLYDLTAFINKHEINWMYITPSVARTLTPTEVPSLETLTLVGEPVGQHDLQQWQAHARLRVHYGACEMGAYSTIAEFADGSNKSPRNIGRGENGHRFFLTDPRNPQRLAPIGAIGEIVCEGPHLAVGYLDDEQQTAENFVEGLTWIDDSGRNRMRRAFRTGDLARYNADGSMNYIARKGGFTKLRGQKLALGEIEEKVLRCPSVRHTVCAVPEQGSLARRLVCLVVLADARSSEAAAETLAVTDSSLETAVSQDIEMIRSQVSKIAPAYARPDVWIVVQALPFNASRKISRNRVHEWLAESSLNALSLAVPSAPMARSDQDAGDEQKLRALWAEVLGIPVDQTHVDRSFLSHGGDSISSIRLVSALRRAGFSATPADVLQGLTIADIADKRAPPSPASAAQQELQPAVVLEEARPIWHNGHIEAVHDCSPLQDGMITSQAASPDRYTLSMLVRLKRKGANSLALTSAQVKVAWTSVVAQQPMLRTLFLDSSSTKTLFSQTVLEDYCPKTITIHAQSEEEAFRTLRGHSLLIEDQEPPHHLAICDISDSNAVLCRLDISHACVDALSLMLLWRDVSMACDSKLPLRKIPTYGMYVEDMQRNFDLAAASRYWKEQLRRTVACNLSVSPPKADCTRNTAIHLVPFTGFSELQSFCRETSLTAASVIRAAWAMMLSLCTGQVSCCFGYVSSGRDHDTLDLREVVGPFLNVLLCTAEVLDQASVRALIADMQAGFIESLPHQFAAFTPFAQESLRGGGRLFNTLVSVWPSVLLPEATDSSVEYESVLIQDPTEYDLALNAILSAASPKIELSVDLNRFSASQARRIAAMFGQILHSTIAADPTATIESVCTLDEDI